MTFTPAELAAMKRKPFRSLLHATGARGIIDSETAESDIKRLGRRLKPKDLVLYRSGGHVSVGTFFWITRILTGRISL
jgi:hypothetical protein